MLETRRLGRSDLEITKVGIGTAPIGSTPNWRVYWGPQDEKTAIRAIQTALHAGVNWIDTAPFYGWGKAEEIVGKAVKDRREEVYIFTKCGTIPDDPQRTSNQTRSNVKSKQASEGSRPTTSTSSNSTMRTQPRLWKTLGVRFRNLSASERSGTADCRTIQWT